ncbi:MAG: hypothetical protein DRP08_06015 [Candidatus Aenigmatarchaeota archaeon]|nr:MAG: hypothetical protein DRP08_06015 [Candidatus Aenigmarchaeota archaeon]
MNKYLEDLHAEQSSYIPVSLRINSKVKTPIGSGFVQGKWQGNAVLVRMKVTEEIKKVLHHSVTPRATYSALFVFPANKVGMG